MGLFSKKETKQPKATCLYTGASLKEKAAQQMIKRIIVQGVKNMSSVQAILAAVAFPTTQNYAVLTESDIYYLTTTNGMTFRTNKYTLDTITSVSTEGKSTFLSNIVFSIGGAGLVELDIKAAAHEMNEFCDMIRTYIKKSSSTSITSSADEILKYKQLLDLGAITQEEFDAKKKKLLEL